MELWQRFTRTARRAILLAHNQAAETGAARIGTEHILLGLLLIEQGVAREVLQGLGLDLDELRRELAEEIEHGREKRETDEIAFTPEAQRVLQRAFVEAKTLGHTPIGTEHILIAIVREDRGAAHRVLHHKGLDVEGVRRAVAERPGSQEEREPKGPSGDDPWAELLSHMSVASSHSHHGRPDQHADLDLDKLIARTYVGWCGVDPGETHEDRERFVDEVGANTYFVWLSKAVAELYGEGEITADNWDAISSAIREAHQDPEHHFRLLTERCRYRFAVQDSYWAPGDDLGRPELFRPTYRINSWVMSCHRGVADHNGNSPWDDPDFDPGSLDDYLDLCEQAIEHAASRGAVAVKSALAYDRPVAFDNPDREAAERAFRAQGKLQRGDQLAFGDVVMRRICAVAERLALPVQVHLGLGIISGSRPMLFEPVIAAYPNVKFDLFHGGYPWRHEIGGLLHNYANVIADMCWLPLISTTTAVGALHEYLDVARSSDRIIWGDDTWTGEEAYAAVLAWRFVVGEVLEQRVHTGLCSAAQASRLAEKLMYENAERLFAR